MLQRIFMTVIAPFIIRSTANSLYPRNQISLHVFKFYSLHFPHFSCSAYICSFYSSFQKVHPSNSTHNRVYFNPRDGGMGGWVCTPVFSTWGGGSHPTIALIFWWLFEDRVTIFFSLHFLFCLFLGTFFFINLFISRH